MAIDMHVWHDAVRARLIIRWGFLVGLKYLGFADDTNFPVSQCTVGIDWKNICKYLANAVTWTLNGLRILVQRSGYGPPE